MVPRSSVIILAAAWLAALPVNGSGLYTKTSPVLQVDAKSYDNLIARSNHTSIVEFYAPWCGHCQNLKPAYEKAAKNLAGLAKVAAIDCDDDSNKPFCGSMGVQGFPTLKIIRPGKKTGKPLVEDYQGQRTAKAIVDAVVDKIPNHVTRIQDAGLEDFLGKDKETPKALLFTKKGTTSALLRALAVDFLGRIPFGQVRSKESNTVERFGVASFPTLVLLPGGDQEPRVYDGDMKKESMLDFLSQAASPNPDPAPKKSKATSTKKLSKSGKSKSAASSSSFAEASASHQSADASSEAAGATSILLEETAPTESPGPIVSSVEEQPMAAPLPDVPPPIPTLSTPEDLQQSCLGEKTGTCVLVLLPRPASPDSALPDFSNNALLNFAEVADKYAKSQRKMFPFYSVPAPNPAATTLRSDLGLTGDTELEVVAVSGKRGWWRRFGGETFTTMTVESWIDQIRLNEGEKVRLPEGVLHAKEEVEHNEL